MDIVINRVVFNIGDVVRLKSGGPMMTVTGQMLGNYGCAWFENGTLQSVTLPFEALYSKDEVDAQEAAYIASLDSALC